MDTDAFIAEIKKIPPVTRFMTGSALCVTLPVMLQLVSAYQVMYHWTLVQNLELWRLWTTFFYGGSGITFLFDFIMLYRTSNSLETQSYGSRSADYAWQLMLTCGGLLALNHPLSTHILHRPFLLTLAYLSSRLQPNALYSLFGLMTIEAKWWPYVLVALDGVMGGKQTLARSLTGLVAGHAWWLLAWRDAAAQQSSFARAPGWLRSLIPSPTAAAGATGPQPRAFGTAPRAAARPGRPTGYQWGTGRRLGDS
ncbi:DER1-domain-containing protein [Hysterangium stoloniferum]|nr:DER1-domain-containing protein [Hysterangium stoloniferum]